jgi:hypothetical protein
LWHVWERKSARKFGLIYVLLKDVIGGSVPEDFIAVNGRMSGDNERQE